MRPQTPTTLAHIGLIGGLGPAATALYYEHLVKGAAVRGAELRLTIGHASVERVLRFAQEGDIPGMCAYLVPHLDALGRAGAAVFAVGAVTPHVCIPGLSTATGLPLVDMVGVINDRLQERRGRVALMGTRTVVASRLFGRLRADIADPTPVQIDQVHDAYVAVVAARRVDAAAVANLRRLASDIVERTGANTLVLAGTEFSLAPPATWADLPTLDCTQMHVAAILDAAQASDRSACASTRELS